MAALLPPEDHASSSPQNQNQPFTARTKRRLHAETVFPTDSPRTRDLKTLRAKRLAYFMKLGKKPTTASEGGVNETNCGTVLSNSNTATDLSSTGLKDFSDCLTEKDQSDHSPIQDLGICLHKETILDSQSLARGSAYDLDYHLLQDTQVPENQKLRHVLSWAQTFLNTPFSDESDVIKNPSTVGSKTSMISKDHEPSGLLSSGEVNSSTLSESNISSSSSDQMRDCPPATPSLFISHMPEDYYLQYSEFDTEKIKIADQEKIKWTYRDSEDKSPVFPVANCCLNQASCDSSARTALGKCAQQERQTDGQIFLLSDLQGDRYECLDEVDQSRCIDLKSVEVQNMSMNDSPRKEHISPCISASSDFRQHDFWSLLEDISAESGFACSSTISTRLSKESAFDVNVLKDYFSEPSLKKETVMNGHRSADAPGRQTYRLSETTSRWHLQLPSLETKEDNGTAPVGHTSKQSCWADEIEENGARINDPRKHFEEIPGFNFFNKSLPMDGNQGQRTEMKTNSTYTAEVEEIKDGTTRNGNEMYALCSGNKVEQFAHCTNKKPNSGLIKFCPDCSSPNESDINWCMICGCALIGIIPRADKDDSGSQNIPMYVYNLNTESVDFSRDSEKTNIQRTSVRNFADFEDTERNAQIAINSHVDLSSDLSVYDKYLMCVDHLNSTKKQCSRKGTELNNGRDTDQRNGPELECIDSLADGYGKSESKSANMSENAFLQQQESRKTKQSNACDLDFEDSRNLGLSFSSEDNVVTCEENVVMPSVQNATEQTAPSQFRSVAEKTFDHGENQSRAQMPSKSKVIKPKRSQNNGPSLAGSKRYWKKSSIAWSSYGPGELKPRSNLTNRPLSAGRCRTSGTETPPQKTTTQAGAVQRNFVTNVFPNPRKQKLVTGDDDHISWLSLPDELWILILSMISHKDLSKVAQTCRRFHRLADDKTLWQVVQIENSVSLNDNWLSSIGRHCPQSLTLYRCQGEAITDGGLDDLFSQCKDSLKELNITSCSGPKLNGNSVLVHCSRHCINLKSADISWTGATDTGIKSLVNACPSLQSLAVNGCQMTDDALNALVKGHGKSLNRLEMFGCHALSAKCMRSLADECPNLKVLNIGQIPKITDICLAHMIPRFKHLTWLNVTGLNVVRDRTVHYIARHCPKMDSLILSSCPLVTDVSLVEISTYLPTIRYLDVSGCRKVTDTGVQAIALTCHHLQYLDLSSTGAAKRGVCLLANYCSRSLECLKLSFCKALSEDSVKKLCRNCKRLKLLHLYGCHSIRNVKDIREINHKVEVHHDLSLSTSYQIRE
ncbi:uncharacterized protein LOC136754885 isoform X2 [Amia ocellicauda]|uniref:uncharacterized protein LOC136754885 isoform X2 n=1 Tax=Amia ocellicauda TaxID=2972642 RepID=UPI003463FC9B